MRKILMSVVLSLGAVNANAVSYAKTGKVKDILLRTSAPQFVIFYIEGFAAAGTCRTHNDTVILSLNEDEKGKAMYSLLLASYVSLKEVRVVVDDTDKYSDGICKVQDIRVNG